MENPIEKLTQEFAKFPGVGPKTANRFVLYLIKMPVKEIKSLLEGIIEVKKNINICQLCNNFFISKEKEPLCLICKNPKRDKDTLCIVENETDLEALEKTKKYQGLYYILEGNVINSKKEVFQERITSLEKRVSQSNFKEIIIATNPTTEGETTRLYLERKLRNKKIPKITHLGRGLPIGGELEYADPETLESALDSRR